MPGFLTVTGQDVDPASLALDLEAVGPLVIDHKTFAGGCAVRFTNPKFLDDKVFEEDDDVVVALDGVVYNFRELQSRHGCAGYFETVKALYRESGERFFEALDGDAAGVLYDKARGTCVAFTNHTASKPLFYWRDGGVVVCSTDFRVLMQALRSLGKRVSLDVFGAYCMITYGYMLEDVTLADGVKKLKAGQYLVHSAEGLTVDAYLHLRNEPAHGATREEVVEAVDHLFAQAVTRQYEKDREYGYDHLVTLSGGLDSRMNVWVAHRLGYAPQVAFTFAQTGYLDERIARRIASDLGLEFVFYSLDGGHYVVPQFRPAMQANGGLVLFSGSAHLLAALRRLDMRRSGLLHTGMIGDAVLGSFIKDMAPRRARLGEGAYSKHLLHRVAPDVERILRSYETEDEFLMYNRAFNGALNGNWTTYQLTECASPFLDRDMLVYSMRIPRALRCKEQIYRDWILAKHPGAARYMWEKAKAKVGDPALVARLKKYAWMAGIVLRGRWDQVSMNPFKHWYKANPALRKFMLDYWRDHAPLLDAYPDLREDCRSLFEEGPRGFLEKAQVMTLLAAMEMYFS